jgi:hypothetical protein
VEEVNAHQLEFLVKIRADIPEGNYGANVVVMFPVPKNAASINPDVGLNSPGQTAEYRANENKVGVVWLSLACSRRRLCGLFVVFVVVANFRIFSIVVFDSNYETLYVSNLE